MTSAAQEWQVDFEKARESLQSLRGAGDQGQVGLYLHLIISGIESIVEITLIGVFTLTSPNCCCTAAVLVAVGYMQQLYGSSSCR